MTTLVESTEAVQVVQEDLDFAGGLFSRGNDFIRLEQMRVAFPRASFPTATPTFTSRDALIRLKERGCAVLYTPAGLTGKKLYDVMENKTLDGQKFFWDTGWYGDRIFFTAETTGSAPHFRVFSRALSSLAGKNFLDQTGTLIDEAEGLGIKAEIVERVRTEFKAQEDEIRRLLTADWQEAARRLIKLEANQRFRPNFAQQAWFLAAYERINQERLTANVWAWTNSLSDSGHLVGSGVFGRFGVFVNNDGPRFSDGRLRGFFSCDVSDLILE